MLSREEGALDGASVLHFVHYGETFDIRLKPRLLEALVGLLHKPLLQAFLSFLYLTESANVREVRSSCDVRIVDTVIKSFLLRLLWLLRDMILQIVQGLYLGATKPSQIKRLETLLVDIMAQELQQLSPFKGLVSVHVDLFEHLAE